MKQDWTDEELIEHWTLEPADYYLLANKRGATRLGFALQLKYFQIAAGFPNCAELVPALAVSYLAKQLLIPSRSWRDYDWENRTVKFHRTQIREKFGFREATELDQEAAVSWMASDIAPFELNDEKLLEELRRYFREWKLEPPTAERMNRIVRSSANRFEEAFADTLFGRLPETVTNKLFALLERENQESKEKTGLKIASAAASTEKSPQAVRIINPPTLVWLRSEPGKLTLENVRDELRKLRFLRQLDLPADLFASVSPKIVAAFRQRLVAESSSETARHLSPLKATLLAAFCYLREQEIIDNVVKLLLGLTHKINTHAEKTVVKQSIGEVKRVAGKQSILLKLAQTAVANPDGVIKEKLFPVVGEQTLKDLIK